MSTTIKDSVHFHSKLLQNWWRVELRLKIGQFWAQNASWLYSFATVHSKWPKLVPDFVETRNGFQHLRTNSILGSKFSISLKYCAIPFCLRTSIKMAFCLSLISQGPKKCTGFPILVHTIKSQSCYFDDKILV